MCYIDKNFYWSPTTVLETSPVIEVKVEAEVKAKVGIEVGVEVGELYTPYPIEPQPTPRTSSLCMMPKIDIDLTPPKVDLSLSLYDLMGLPKIKKSNYINGVTQR